MVVASAESFFDRCRAEAWATSGLRKRAGSLARWVHQQGWIGRIELPSSSLLTQMYTQSMRIPVDMPTKLQGCLCQWRESLAKSEKLSSDRIVT